MELKGSKTEKNLMDAFAGESQAHTKFQYYASAAKKEGYNQIGAIFTETAGNEKEHALGLEELTPFLQSCADKEPEMYVALYADETVPYREIVKVLNIANENHFKMVLATRPPETKKK